ncbi:MAG TPA: DNA mismatch repair endonuclease MutL [Arachidicoccus sp.]|nr:DNA mismatch repair endonuclease MutL [Arachidicoccus sp.]
MDIIKKLPDNIANQIAAGEVIQRPASAVKELMENAIDAGATEVRLVVQDAGKALIQVVDNGKGMSETDAAMSIARHATSKIQQIDDLFKIKTMGFRGEALASIAAVAQVVLKTKRAEDETGVYLEVEHSEIVNAEPCAMQTGTSFSMKNLFFNVPARRNFLKSNAAELRHIIEEFIRVSMAFPQIFFTLTSNNQEVFHLDSGTLKQRIVQLLGNNLKAQLVAVNDETDYINIHGFIGKPDVSKKTRGDQYIFVNNRYIKSAYLNHAIVGAFNELIPKENFPLYVLFIDIDPAQVDINVHPTKQEIKFEDEKIIYAFVKAAIKHSLAQSSVAPSLDFSLNPEIQQLDAINKPFSDQEKTAATTSKLFQTFTQKNQAHFIDGNKEGLKNWQDFYKPFEAKPATDDDRESEARRIDAFLKSDFPEDGTQEDNQQTDAGNEDTDIDRSMPAFPKDFAGFRLPEDPGGEWQVEQQQRYTPGESNDDDPELSATGQVQDQGAAGPIKEFGAVAGVGFDYLHQRLNKTVASQLLVDAALIQVKNTYILAPTANGFILVHQQLAHERILYEQFSKRIHKKSSASQQVLIPSELSLSTSDSILLEELMPELNGIGYYLSKRPDQIYEITGVPADITGGSEAKAIELLLEQFKHFNSEIRFSKREKVVRCLSRQQAVKAGKLLSQAEMQQLVEELFACEISHLTPNGDSPTYIDFKEDYLDGLFGINKR